MNRLLMVSPSSQPKSFTYITILPCLIFDGSAQATDQISGLSRNIGTSIKHKDISSSHYIRRTSTSICNYTNLFSACQMFFCTIQGRSIYF